MRRRVTLKDVAEAVGVHVSTVSRALDPKTRHLITPDVADQIMQRQRAARLSPERRRLFAEDEPHAHRRRRAARHHQSDLSADHPRRRGCAGARTATSRSSPIPTATCAARRASPRRLRARGVDGLILASVEREDEAVIAAGRGRAADRHRQPARRTTRNISSVVHDEDEGIRRILDAPRLARAPATSPTSPARSSSRPARTRYRAFERHRAALGLDADPALVAFAHTFNEAEGERCTEALLAGGRAFTAIVCSNDRLAIGAIAALRRRGLACPDDVSVTGYNDMPMVDRLFPPLTTIRIQQYRAGFEAAELLYEHAADAGRAAPAAPHRAAGRADRARIDARATPRGGPPARVPSEPTGACAAAGQAPTIVSSSGQSSTHSCPLSVTMKVWPTNMPNDAVGGDRVGLGHDHHARAS